MKILLSVVGIALLCASCTPTPSATTAIDSTRAEAPVRHSCPAFRDGDFEPDSARSYGAEQVTTFQNGSKYNCRCIAKTAGQAPRCQQVRRFVLGNIE